MSFGSFLFLLLFSFSSLFGKSSISQQKQFIDSKLREISREIEKEKKAIETISKELKILDKELRRGKSKYHREKSKLKALQEEADKLVLESQKIREKMIDISAKLISISIVNNGKDLGTINSVIFSEVFETIRKKNKQKLKLLDQSLQVKKKKIEELSQKIEKLSTSIKNVENKKKLIKQKKKEREKLIVKLKKRKDEYRKRLKEIALKQKKIREAVAKAKRESNKGKKRSRIKGSRTKDSSSYRKEAVRRYRGKKTIAPLKNYEIITRFGTYIDPIYKFKIFSSALVLKPKKPHAKVRNIFKGRVTLMKENKTLGKFIVIEHDNGLQTVFAYLDSFSPSIHKGKRIRKGAIVGRVSKKLYFEVMKGNYRIDPLEVIK